MSKKQSNKEILFAENILELIATGCKEMLDDKEKRTDDFIEQIWRMAEFAARNLEQQTHQHENRDKPNN